MGELHVGEPHRELWGHGSDGKERYSLRPAYRTLKVKQGERSLVAIGLHHSNNPHDPIIRHVLDQFYGLAREVRAENMTLISEGGRRAYLEGDPQEVLQAKSEQQLLTNLALEQGIDVVSGEPRNGEDLHAAVNVLVELGANSPFALYGYYVGRMGPQLLREGDVEYAAKIYKQVFNAYKNRLGEGVPLAWAGYSYDDFTRDFQTMYGTPLGIGPEAVAHMFHDTVGFLNQPKDVRQVIQTDESHVSLVARAVNFERDKCLFRCTEQYFATQEKSVFIPYGLAHIENMQGDLIRLGGVVEESVSPHYIHPMEQLTPKQ